MALQHRLRVGVWLLEVDAPIFELFERNRYAGDGAAHESARSDDTEISVEIFDLGLARHRGGAVGSVQHVFCLGLAARGPATHNIVAPRDGANPPRPR